MLTSLKQVVVWVAYILDRALKNIQLTVAKLRGLLVIKGEERSLNFVLMYNIGDAIWFLFWLSKYLNKHHVTLSVSDRVFNALSPVICIENIELRRIKNGVPFGAHDVWIGGAKYRDALKQGDGNVQKYLTNYFSILTCRFKNSANFHELNPSIGRQPIFDFDIQRIIRPTSAEVSFPKLYDCLVINSPTLSGQSLLTPKDFLEIVECISRYGLSVVTTEKIPGFDCTREIADGTLAEIFLVLCSGSVRFVVGNPTGPFWFSVTKNCHPDLQFVVHHQSQKISLDGYNMTSIASPFEFKKQVISLIRNKN